jgi:hypothetical protein
LGVDGRWLLLDFEFFARVQVPLYDAFHLVRTAWDARDLRRPAVPSWIDELTSGSVEANAYRQILTTAATALGISPTQAGGAFVYYIVDIAARLNRRKLSPDHVAPFLAEAHRLARWIASGRRPDEPFLFAD